MFVRGLWDVSLNGDLIEVSLRHLILAGNLVVSYEVFFLMEHLVKIWYFYEYFFKNVIVKTNLLWTLKTFKGNAQFVQNTFGLCLRWIAVRFWGVIRKCFLAWIVFKGHNKGIATKLAEKMGREDCWSAVL